MSFVIKSNNNDIVGSGFRTVMNGAEPRTFPSLEEASRYLAVIAARLCLFHKPADRIELDAADGTLHRLVQGRTQTWIVVRRVEQAWLKQPSCLQGVPQNTEKANVEM